MKPRTVVFDGRRTIRLSLAIAGVGTLASIAGALVDARRLAASYLTAWAFTVFLAVAALVLLLTCNAMRAGWPTLIRRLLEAMVGALPAVAVLSLPVLAALPWLYPWVHPERLADKEARHAVLHRAAYMNPGFFILRAVVYLAIWIAIAALLRRWSFAQDRGSPDRGRSYVASGILLPALALTLTLASFDWLMSLEPAWYSTMFPVYVFASGFVGAIAVLTVLARTAHRTGYLEGFDPSHSYALGRLLLAFTIFWAYAAFFQLMLIWIANKPEEVVFYLERWEGPWARVSILLAAVRFVVPFAILIPYRIKRRPRALAGVAAFIVAATYVDFHWLVMPAAARGDAPYRWIDLAALAMVSGLSVAFAAFRLQGRPTVPIGDPRLGEALAYRSV